MSADELKPSGAGTYYGERSREGEWYWHGTGAWDDDWKRVPPVRTLGSAFASKPEPEPLVAPTLTKGHVQTLPTMDFANQNKFTLPTLPGSLTWVYIGQCWARHDIIRVSGLT